MKYYLEIVFAPDGSEQPGSYRRDYDSLPSAEQVKEFLSSNSTASILNAFLKHYAKKEEEPS